MLTLKCWSSVPSIQKKSCYTAVKFKVRPIFSSEPQEKELTNTKGPIFKQLTSYIGVQMNGQVGKQHLNYFEKSDLTASVDDKYYKENDCI